MKGNLFCCFCLHSLATWVQARKGKERKSRTLIPRLQCLVHPRPNEQQMTSGPRGQNASQFFRIRVLLKYNQSNAKETISTKVLKTLNPQRT